MKKGEKRNPFGGGSTDRTGETVCHPIRYAQPHTRVDQTLEPTVGQQQASFIGTGNLNHRITGGGPVLAFVLVQRTISGPYAIEANRKLP
ncbi:brain-specific angiogenesis inhibitor 1-associated protein 2-like protein [Anopheles sinensis]|uniref:Brain-specific angiogenesis inhibitor 1-associated protein 2-like protein n=1 Tax=Anopheles sinensis TaxID=74873 RepID=A0A084WKI9_ANOSI|nr:brain-specific angiogenesis inhibitor 1-associated protein 2-like protein [Anopheles sinensis]